MSDDLIARGKAIAESGKYLPPRGEYLGRLESDVGDEPPGGPPPDDAMMTAAEVLQQAGMISAAELDRLTFPPLRWHVPGLVPEGFGLLVAPPKAGKSWMVAAVGLACASGGKAFGCIGVDERPVLYLALEDGPRRLQDRHRTLMGSCEIPAIMRLIFDATPLTAPAIIAAFLELHGTDCPLVIVDTLVRIRPTRRREDEPYQFDYMFAARLKGLVDDCPGSSLLAVHHSRKATAEDFVDTVSGTNGLAAAADFLMVLRHPRLSPIGTLLVTGRDVPEGEFALRSDAGRGWRLDGNSLDEAAANAEKREQQGRLGDRSLELVQFFNNRGIEGAGAAEAAKATGIEEKQVYTYLGRLVDSGVLVKPKRGLYISAVCCVGTVGNSSETNTSNTTNTTPLWGGEP